jgi:hypothetical protein
MVEHNKYFNERQKEKIYKNNEIFAYINELIT